MGKATNFKFGRYIHRVHLHKNPLKFGRKESMGAFRDCPNFFEYHLLSQEQVKLRTLNLAGIFSSQGPCEQKLIKSLGERECGRIQGLPKFSEYPLLY